MDTGYRLIFRPQSSGCLRIHRLVAQVATAAGILLATQDAWAAERQAPVFDKQIDFHDMTPAEKTAAKREARKHHYDQITFCADPGNMPLSNNRAEGLQNKIAEAVGRRMDTRVNFFWRPFIERGLTRETFANNECEVLIEVPAGYEHILTTEPIYRSTYVLATRTDRGIDISGFDDPQLKDLKIGVFQHSAFREALARHGIKDHLDLHVISHDADLEPEKQPFKQVERVVSGDIDAAGVWGPFAGWVKAQGAPITLQPVNRMEDTVVLEFSLAFGVRTNDPVLKYALDFALTDEKDTIAAILKDFGVPLVQCSNCIVSGDIPSHGTYFDRITEEGQKRFTEVAPEATRTIDTALATPDQIVTIEKVKAALAAGAKPDDELAKAVLASDETRIGYLLVAGADIDSMDRQGATPLVTATLNRDTPMMETLIDHGASVDQPDRNGWRPLHHAVLRNHVPSVALLAARGSDLSAETPGGISPLGLAIGEGKYWAAQALIEAGAPVDARFGRENLTPLMVAATQSEAVNRDVQIANGPSAVELADLLVAHGADPNAASLEGVTPLMVAAGYDNEAMIAFLVKSGADIGARSKMGRSALDVARTARADGAIKALTFFAGTKQPATAQ